MALTIYLMVGWCSMGTFNDPCSKCVETPRNLDPKNPPHCPPKGAAKPSHWILSPQQVGFFPQNVLSIEGIICMYIYIYVCMNQILYYIHVFSYILLHIYGKIYVDDPHVSNDITIDSIDDENQTDPWDFNRPSHRKIWRTPPTVHWKSWGLWDYNGWMAKKTHLFDHQPWISHECGKPNALNHPKLDDGWPESVEEQGLLSLVWRRNFRNDIWKLCYRQSRRGVSRQNSEKCKTIVCIANTFTHTPFYTETL